MRLRMLIAIGSIITLIALPQYTLADAQTAPTRLTLGEPAKAARGHLTLKATLVNGEGKAIGERRVNFYEHVTVFGDRDALLGTATTDSTGYAAIDYQPAELGAQTIIARFGGDEQYAAVQVESRLEVREVVPLYTPAPLPLASVRQWLPLGLGSLVVATWAALIGVTIRAIVGVRNAGDPRTTSAVKARIAQEGTMS
jgi:hypothetical protein